MCLFLLQVLTYICLLNKQFQTQTQQFLVSVCLYLYRVFYSFLTIKHNIILEEKGTLYNHIIALQYKQTHWRFNTDIFDTNILISLYDIGINIESYLLFDRECKVEIIISISLEQMLKKIGPWLYSSSVVNKLIFLLCGFGEC